MGHAVEAANLDGSGKTVLPNALYIVVAMCVMGRPEHASEAVIRDGSGIIANAIEIVASSDVTISMVCVRNVLGDGLSPTAHPDVLKYVLVHAPSLMDHVRTAPLVTMDTTVTCLVSRHAYNVIEEAGTVCNVSKVKRAPTVPETAVLPVETMYVTLMAPV